MRSQLVERLGVQTPQLVHLPPDVHSLDAAQEAIDLADAYGVADGFPLDEAQRFTLRAGLGEREDGTWAAATVANFVARQNGKNDTAAARELAGLVLFGERLIIHTAHEVPTAIEAFNRLVAVFENWDDLRSKVARIRYANGEQAIELLTGQRLKYKARTGGSGRGFAKADLVVYDEAQHIQAEHIAASGPTRLANPNSQSWYMGSGGLATSVNAWRLRRRALAGDAGRFAYVEHTAEDVRLVDGRVVSSFPEVLDRDAWARANPAYGYRISDEALVTLYDELGPDLFGRECLCLWEPAVDVDQRIFSVEQWTALQDPGSKPKAPLVFGFDVAPDRGRSSIAVADGSCVELLECRSGVGWTVPRLVELAKKWDASVALDPAAAAGSFLRELLDGGVSVVEVAGRELVQACGAFFDAVVDSKIRVHPNLAELDWAVAGAAKRSVGDAWAWGRRTSDADITPLVAVTLAYWASRHNVVPAVPVFAFG